LSLIPTLVQIGRGTVIIKTSFSNDDART